MEGGGLGLIMRLISEFAPRNKGKPRKLNAGLSMSRPI